MKVFKKRCIKGLLCLTLLGCSLSLRAQTTDKEEVIKIIHKVNNYWQTNHPVPGWAFWENAAYHTGNMEVYALTGEESYRKYSELWAEKNKWKGAESDDIKNWKYSYGETGEYVLFGDWQTCFQTYADLYLLDPAEHKIARAREVMEYQMSTSRNDYWWWADGLYMVMPVMTKLYKITQKEEYLEKLYVYFAYARDLMYDGTSGLFYRDAKYIYPKHQTRNKQKDFWARGNGWVFAALAKVLADLPEENIYRNEYISVFRKMAEALKASQQKEGFWSRSILDKQHAPGYETSGTAFISYGYLWGVNNGLLEQSAYEETINKGLEYLLETALQPTGVVGYIQPIGERADQHENVGPETTSNFGVGAFLLATSEYVRYLENTNK